MRRVVHPHLALRQSGKPVAPQVVPDRESPVAERVAQKPHQAQEELGDIPADRHLPADPDRPEPCQHAPPATATAAASRVRNASTDQNRGIPRHLPLPLDLDSLTSRIEMQILPPRVDLGGLRGRLQEIFSKSDSILQDGMV